MVQLALLKWFKTGAIGLVSAAASDIMQLLRNLADISAYTVARGRVPEGYLEKHVPGGIGVAM